MPTALYTYGFDRSGVARRVGVDVRSIDLDRSTAEVHVDRRHRERVTDRRRGRLPDADGNMTVPVDDLSPVGLEAHSAV